ncbi:tetratricopeptide repeat protein [Sorangium sp. So ce887]|uniref:tetratricopeptide repeat protein n=1 Tax=Sorangium sp. So ce887 TaxID=3133324 RepID=UPI003F648133
MNDPKRWIEEERGAPAGARELLRSAVRPRPMTPVEAARTAARVAPLAAAPSGGAPLPMWAKGLLVVAGLGAGGLALHGVVQGGLRAAVLAPPPPRLEHLPPERLLSIARGAMRSVEAAPAAPALDPLSPAAEAPRPAASAPRREPPPRNVRQNKPAPPPAPAGSAASESDALLREATRLEQARARLAQSPEASLAALDEHRREFPRGQLTAEREFIAIDALMRLGRTEEARAHAEAFLARYASSPYAERVRRLAGRAPSGSAP